MNNKFKLGHVVLYAKDWYQKSDDIWADLKQMLIYDDYTPFTNNDIFNIITARIDDVDLGNQFKLSSIFSGIHPRECWYYGYECTKENYDVQLAFLHYILSVLKYLSKDQYEFKIPKYDKTTPRPKDIELKTVIKFFNKNKKNLNK